MFWKVLCSTNINGTCHKQTQLRQEMTSFSSEYISLCAVCFLLHLKCRCIVLLLVQCNSLWEVWIVCFHLQDFFCWEDLSIGFLQDVGTRLLNNTESLWCCYCMHCELQMLHISHYCLWRSTDLSKFEVQKHVQQSTFLLKSFMQISVISWSNEFLADRNKSGCCLES